MKQTNILFLCGKNRKRSPTAEHIFAGRADLEVRSAGLDNDADYQCAVEDIEWANIIFVMESSQKAKVTQKFKPHLKKARIICLNIRDDYEYMEQGLVELLNKRITPHLPFLSKA